MKFASNRVLAVSMSAAALTAAFGLGVQLSDVTAHVQAAPDSPVHLSPVPPSPPPPSPAPAMTQAPGEDNSYGQGDGGAGGGGGGG